MAFYELPNPSDSKDDELLTISAITGDRCSGKERLKVTNFVESIVKHYDNTEVWLLSGGTLTNNNGQIYLWNCYLFRDPMDNHIHNVHLCRNAKAASKKPGEMYSRQALRADVHKKKRTKREVTHSGARRSAPVRCSLSSMMHRLRAAQPSAVHCPGFRAIPVRADRRWY